MCFSSSRSSDLFSHLLLLTQMVSHVLSNFRLTGRILSWLKWQSKPQIIVFPVSFFHSHPGSLLLPFLFFFLLFHSLKKKLKSPFNGVCSAGWLRLRKLCRNLMEVCIRRRWGNAMQKEIHYASPQHLSPRSLSFTLRFLHLLPQIFPPPPPLLPPLLPNISPPQSQHSFSQHFYWWAFNAMSCSASRRCRVRLVSFLDSQRATSHSVCLMAHTGSCALNPHILTNAFLDDGWTCSAEFSNVGTKAVCEALWKCSASPCMQASILLHNQYWTSSSEL